MLEKINIRVADHNDVTSLVKFNQLMAWETEQKRLDSDILSKGVAALIADDNKGFYLVAEQSGQVVGSLMVTTEWSDWRNGVFWWVQSVYISPYMMYINKRFISCSLYNNYVSNIYIVYIRKQNIYQLQLI